MIDDPYRVLGVSRDATPEQIKSAYRQKAKQYHPDLHPNDPNAAAKMNEINEAYDMLTNPEKYAARQAQQQGYGSYGGYGGYGQNQYGQGQYGRTQYGQSGQSGQYGRSGQNGRTTQGTGWESDFGFNFEDLFGFGYAGTASTRPEHMPGDSAEIRRAVASLQQERFAEALGILTNIRSTARNARWYYLSALANNGLGNTVQAIDQMTRAAQMEPQNRTYTQLLRQFRQAGQTYQRQAAGYNMQAIDLNKLCMICCMMQLCCGGRVMPICCI